MADVPDQPHPLAAEEVAERKAKYEFAQTIGQGASEQEHNRISDVLALVATVEARDTQLADAHAVIRRYVEGWELDYYDARPNEEFWRHPFGTEDEPMTPGEVAAIAAARATEGDGG